MDDDTDIEPRTPKRRKIVVWSALTIFVLAAILAVLWLMSPPTKQGPTIPARGFDECRVGIVASANDRTLVLKTEGGPTRRYTVTKDYVVKLDIPHMRQHSAVGQSTLIYSYKDGKKSVAVDSDDAPLSLADAPPCKP